MITQEQYDKLLADVSSVAVAGTYEEVVAFLRRSGLERIAARLDYLRQVVDEDSASVEVASSASCGRNL